MQNARETVLGSEYEMVINEELSKLDQSSKLLLGDVCAILHRQDESLGRPANECLTADNSKYIVFLPSKQSIFCCKELGIIRNPGSEYKLISLSSFLEQLVEFNFSFVQLLCDNDIKYSTKEFDSIKYIFNDMLTLSDSAVKLMYTKFYNTAYGVYTQIQSKKFSGDQLDNRIFLMYKLYSIVKNFESDQTITLDTLDLKEYNEIKKNPTIMKSKFDDLFVKLKINKKYDTDYINLFKIDFKYSLMYDIVKDLCK